MQLVKDIRRLVDNGEFLANRYCSSPAIKLIATLVLELITDHSREVGRFILHLCNTLGMHGNTTLALSIMIIFHSHNGYYKLLIDTSVLLLTYIYFLIE